nr:DUF3106 domain-containing protein [Rhodoferax ferrireducens]
MRAIGQLERQPIAGAVAVGVTLCILVALCASAASVLAQGVAGPPLVAPAPAKLPSASASTKNSKAHVSPSKPAWQDLTPAQQVSLMPLAAIWSTLGESNKRKWIAIAANYPALASAEQEKLHSRMTEWVLLSKQQRAQARLNFAQSKQLSPSQKAATWQAYQALSPEEKQKLAKSATPKPAGAAAAVKPVPPQKLATVPVTRHTPKQLPKLSVSTQAVNRNTLLPNAPLPAKPSTAQKD